MGSPKACSGGRADEPISTEFRAHGFGSSDGLDGQSGGVERHSSAVPSEVVATRLNPAKQGGDRRAIG